MSNENLGYNPSLDEIVFENRNKAYGAYDLRQSYKSILTRSMIIGTTLFCLAAATPFIVMKIKQLTAPPKQEVEANLMEILPEEEPILEQPKEETPPPPPPPKVEEEKVEIIQNVVPEPVKAPKVETPPPPISKQLETTTGLINQEGVKKPSYSPPPPPPSTGKGTTVEVKPQVSTTEVYTTVDQEAEFSGGGLNGFRSAFQESFDTSVMDGDEGTVSAELTFVVERDGSLTQVKAIGSNSTFNKEAERAAKSIRKKWSPAKVNGEPVRSRFRMPVKMNFEY
ncbi:energy transducer TonB [Riemerella anatipestifer]|uniref:energy transducer TonB n=1 Tax=Riemerella anatipestifer TaxID=34085 RepID=UPI00129E06EF|nr:energy transducer TonB [Riemerella anatipestifer]MBO4234545.1 energy transducer TonB [Riemerella anatipestifer]MRM82802.1 energy transducer TonB [Riemerella anatipestifer]